MTLVYLLFILLAVYYSYRYDGIEVADKGKTHRYWMLCGLLICISGFSYGLGGDKFVYMEEFEGYWEDISTWRYVIYQNILLSSQMPLWTLLNLIVKRLTGSFYVLQFVQAIIVNVTICYIASKYTKRQFLFLLLYFLSLTYLIFNTEVMREGIAIAMGLLGIDAWLNGKKIRYGIFVALAVLFHISALILLLFPFMQFIRITFNKTTVLWIWGIAFIGWASSDIIINYLLPVLLGGQGQLMLKVIQYSSIASTLFGFLSKSIQYIILPYVVMYFTLQGEEDATRKKKYETIMSYYSIIAIVVCAIAGLTRFKNYTEVFMLIWVSDFLYNTFQAQKHQIIRIGTIMGMFYFVLKFTFSYYPICKKRFIQYYVPYTSILNEDADVYYREALHQETSGNVGANNKNTRVIKF